MALAHPKYWLIWLGFVFWYVLSTLPYRFQLLLGKGVGTLIYVFAKRRRAVAETNIALCYPNTSPAKQKQLVRGVMVSLGIAFFETGIAWFWPLWRLKRIYTLEGLEHLEQAQSDGVGVILLVFHFTHLDIGGKLLNLNVPVDKSYRPNNNPVYDLVQRWGRERLVREGSSIPSRNVRAMIKSLREGHFVSYLPDQDYGAENSIFVPFFGVPTATVTATSELARLGKARVIPFIQTRKSDGAGYHLQVLPPLVNFPSGDVEQDARQVNQVAEACISAQPDQYLWVHRRFKTRPQGEPSFYSRDTNRLHQ